MKTEDKMCVPLSKRDYDLMNALHIMEYGEVLPIAEYHREYVSTYHDKCPRCGNLDIEPKKGSYCPKCGARLLPYRMASEPASKETAS